MKRFIVLLVCFLGMALLTQGCFEEQIIPSGATASSFATEYGLRPIAAAYDGDLATNWSPLLADCTSSDGSYIELEFDAAYAFGKIVLNVNKEGGETQLERAASFTISDADGNELTTGSYTAAESIKEVTFTKTSTNKLRVTFDQVDNNADPLLINCPHINEIETYETKFFGLF